MAVCLTARRQSALRVVRLAVLALPLLLLPANRSESNRSLAVTASAPHVLVSFGPVSASLRVACFKSFGLPERPWFDRLPQDATTPQPIAGGTLSVAITVASQPEEGVQFAAMSDDEMSEVAAGNFQLLELDKFNVLIQDNEAGLFTMDIAQGAFHDAKGLFTTVQAVNSAVNVKATMIVNIFLNGQNVQPN